MTVKEWGIEDFNRLLMIADSKAKNDWEIDFVFNLNAHFDKYGDKMNLSERQYEVLMRITEEEC